MATWTATDVRNVAPEMSVANGVSDATIDFWIAQAENQIDAAIFGSRVNLAGAYLTAHMLKVTGYGLGGGGLGGGAALGAIQSATVGGVSVAFSSRGAASQVSEYLSRTPYGIEFSRLVRLSGATPIVI